MKNEKLFNETVAILVKAFQNGTLEHGICQACAVGNIVAARNPEIEVCGEFPCGDYSWSDVRSKVKSKLPNAFNPCIVKKGLKHIKNTGYSVHEIIMIEDAFDFKLPNRNEDIDGYFGLMAVVDCLMTIHEANEEETKEAKSLFVKVSC